MSSAKNTLSAFRTLGKSKKCLPTDGTAIETKTEVKTTVLQNIRLNIDEADKIAEEIVDLDDFHNAFFIAPINCTSLIENEDEDGEEYWSEMRPLLISRIEKLFGFRYGIDFAILRRGIFSLLAVFTKNEDGDWFVPKNVIDFIVPDSPDVFLRTLELYYRNTDSRFFPINAIAITDKESRITESDVKNRKGTSVETIQVDISFLRDDSFRSTDSNEGRAHFTYNIFMEGIMHAVTMEHRILSFDDGEIDAMIENEEERVCFRKEKT